MRKFWSLTVVVAVISLGIPSLAFSSPASAHARQQNQFGTITGTAKSAKGEALPNYKVQVRDTRTGQIVGQATSNSSGAFSVSGLAPGNYVVEVVNPAGQVVGLSPSVAITAGGVASVTVTATAAGAVGAAAAGGGFSLFVSARPQASALSRRQVPRQLSALLQRRATPGRPSRPLAIGASLT
jgi:hypothetical protein